MKTLRFVGSAGLAGVVLAMSAAHAHAPIFSCERAKEMIACEAGYSDGASAAGKKVTVLDANHKVLMEGTVAKEGTYTFKPPTGAFHVVFGGGQYHEITLYSTAIK